MLSDSVRVPLTPPSSQIARRSARRSGQDRAGTDADSLPNGTSVALGPWEFFGELAILGPGVSRTARVRASTPIRCLAIARGDFDRVLAEQPAIAVAMLPVLAKRIADAET